MVDARSKTSLTAVIGLLLLAFLLTACARLSGGGLTAAPASQTAAATAAVPAKAQATPTTTAQATGQATRQSTAIPTPAPSATHFPVEPCGQLLPLRLPEPAAQFRWRAPELSAELIPAGALPALEYLFAHPDDVSLVVYRVGYEGIGFYHNADRPMPLASVSKLIQLIAYARAVEGEQLDPEQPVAMEELEQFYLPRSDLGAHSLSLRELETEEFRLDDVVWMMTRHSANSAADYVHDLLGQEQIEQTVLDLKLSQHTAPCPFLGRFLTMSNPTRIESDASAIRSLAEEPARYGEEVIRLTEMFAADAAFRGQVLSTWGRRRQPSLTTQELFVSLLETRGTALDYARLMARIVTGEIGSVRSNRLIRDQLEWPYETFELNRERYRTVGYKNGTMPGVLTTVYYAWPHWSDQPMALALFYRNLPNSTYQRWRRDFPHDDLAHWLMSDPNAIHIMHVLRDTAEGSG